jgi:hypothetical protein
LITLMPARICTRRWVTPARLSWRRFDALRMRRPKSAITAAMSGVASPIVRVSSQEIQHSSTTPRARASPFCTTSAKIRSRAPWARVASLTVRESMSPRVVPW